MKNEVDMFWEKCGKILTQNGEIVNCRDCPCGYWALFVFKSRSYNQETGEPYTYTLNGFNGYELKSADGSSVKYHGGFVSKTNTLEFYVEMPEDEALAIIAMLVMPEDVMEDFMAKLFTGDEEGAYALLEQYGAGYSVVMKVTCVKK